MMVSFIFTEEGGQAAQVLHTPPAAGCRNFHT